MLVKIKHFIVIILLIINCFKLSAQSGKVLYQFISPIDSSRFHNPETSIIIRYGDKIDPATLKTDFIKVKGEQSGEHDLFLNLSTDGTTINAKPSTRFHYNEMVQVNISNDIHTTSGKSLPETNFVFWIKPDNINDNLTAIDESLNLFKSIKNTQSTLSDFEIFGESLSKVIDSKNPAEGNIFATLSILGANFLYIMDNEGFPVYLNLMNKKVINFKPWPNGVCSYFNYNGQAFMTLDQEMNYLDTHRMLNGYETNMHEFVLCENGHTLLLAYDRQVMDLSGIVPGGQPDATVTGAVIQELDENKQLLFQWRTWDYFKISDTYVNLTNAIIDYAHVNSIDPDTDTSIIISSRHLNEVTRINKKDGSIIWRMGGKKNQFNFIDDYRNFSGQHSVDCLPNGNIVMYDNGLNPKTEYSRGIEYQVDYQDKKVWLLNEYIHNPYKYGQSMGNFNKFENGNVLIYWGGLKPGEPSMFSEYNINKELTYEVEFSANSLPPYQVYRQKWEPKVFWLDRDSILFDSTIIGQERAEIVALKNISGSEKKIDSVHINSRNYYVDENFPISLQPGEEKLLKIVFKPNYAGNYSNSIIFCSGTDSVFFSKKLKVNSKSSQITGIDKVKDNSLIINPNPFQNELNIKSKTKVKDIIISDLNGKIRYQSTIKSNFFSVSTRDLQTGFYFITITFFDNAKVKKKILKI